jgi:hypothetical protein
MKDPVRLNIPVPIMRMFAVPVCSMKERVVVGGLRIYLAVCKPVKLNLSFRGTYDILLDEIIEPALAFTPVCSTRSEDRYTLKRK